MAVDKKITVHRRGAERAEGAQRFYEGCLGANAKLNIQFSIGLSRCHLNLLGVPSALSAPLR